MLVEQFLEESARLFPEKTALIFGDQRLRYREIEARCNQLAHGLIHQGVQRGDRVAVFLDNSVETVVCIFAILKAGAIFTLVNPATKAEKLALIMANAGARVCITDSRKAATVASCLQSMEDVVTVVIVGAPLAPELPLQAVVGWNDVMETQQGQDLPPAKHHIDIDLAALIYTSGSTGTPKGVMMTHLNMVSAANSVIQYLANTSDDILLNVLPLSSSYGLYQVLMAFKVGGTVILEGSLAYPHTVLRRLMHERVTGFALVPTVAAVLLQVDLSGYRFPALRYITNAGAALPVQYTSQLRQCFPETKVYLMYGLTECKRVSYLPPEQLERRPTSVGKAMPNMEAFVVDEWGHRVPAGQVGELVVRGANVMQGYWKLPEETVKVLKPGAFPGDQLLCTGDLFRMDEEGYLFWVGRKDDIIKSRGEKVSPIEVENVLHGLDEIAMAVVIGVADDVLGQAVKAVVTLKAGKGLTEREIFRHCAKHLAAFMMPTVIEFRDTIPKTAAGKVDKLKLAEENKHGASHE